MYVCCVLCVCVCVCRWTRIAAFEGERECPRVRQGGLDRVGRGWLLRWTDTKSQVAHPILHQKHLHVLGVPVFEGTP